MTKVTNKQIANCFRKALTYLWDGNCRPHGNNREIYICCAIHNTSLIALDECKNIIRGQLGCHAFAEWWLQAQGVSRTCVENRPMMQAWRKQWLEQLIEEFENK